MQIIDMDYKEFQSRYDFVLLSCLKGEEQILEVQDKTTFKIYDYLEIIARGAEIDETIKFCEDLLKLNHPNILKLNVYTYIFMQENLGDPYAKFFLVFDYTENSLDKEIQAVNKKTQKGETGCL